MSIRDNYRIDNHGDRFFIYDFCNRLICSADTKRKAEEDIEKLVMSEEESCPKFLLTCLKAKATWITKNSKAIQIPVEEPYYYEFVCSAKSQYDAIKQLTKPGFVYYNIRALELNNNI